MKLRPVLLVLLLPVLADFLITGCCDCPESTMLSYENCQLIVENLDNAGADPVITETDTILKEAYGIRLLVERSQPMCQHNTIPGFGSAVFATSCSCDPDVIYTAIDSASAIKIITLNYFNSEYPANSDVSELFLTPKYEPVSTVLSRVGENVNYTFDEPNLNVDLLLFTPPQGSGTYRFKLIIEFTDGKILESQTKPVYLK